MKEAFFFLIPLIVAAVGLTGTAAVIASAVISVGLAAGLSYVASKFLSQPGDTQTQPGGVELDLRIDPHVPQSILLGRAVTAGSLVYEETYGNAAGTQNSDMVQIIALADAPVQTLVSVYVDGKRVSISGAGEIGGYGGKIDLRFYDGSQSTVDNFTKVKLGGHAKRPYGNDAVGVGRAYVRIHYRYTPEKVTGPLAFKFVVDGMALYDPRKDTSAGGSGPQTFANLNSHEFTRNPAVMIYNILRGIRVKDDTGATQYIYGPEDTDPAALPYTNWAAAMDACDVVVGGDKSFQAGGEITLDTEPLEAIKQLLLTCNGRLIDLGGTYKLYVSPGASVATFSDDDIVATDPDSFWPILPLEQNINTITGSFTAPNDGYVTRVAPRRVNATTLSRAGRTVTANLDAPMVQSKAQIQRLMKAMLAEATRTRRHSLTLWRKFFPLEPGDVVTWNSTRNGYVAKLFRVDTVERAPDLNVTVGLTELDPTDYDWTPADEIATVDINTEPDDIPDKTVTGLTLTAVEIPGDTGTTRAAIQLTWTDPQDDDLTIFEVQYRVTPDLTGWVWWTLPWPFLVSEPPATIQVSNSARDGTMTIVAGIQHQTSYDVRARFVSYNGFQTEFTAWQTIAVGDVTSAATIADGSVTIEKIQPGGIVTQGFGRSISHVGSGPAQGVTDVALRNNVTIDNLCDGILFVSDFSFTTWNKTKSNKTIGIQVIGNRHGGGNVTFFSTSLSCPPSSAKKKVKFGFSPGSDNHFASGIYDIELRLTVPGGLLTFGWTADIYMLFPRA